MRPAYVRFVAGLLLLVTLAGCGGAPETKVPTAAPATAAPTAAPTEAAKPTEAPAPTEAPTPTPVVHAATIDALAYTQNREGKAEGVVSTVKIRIDPGDGHVAFAEDGPQATGNQWQSAGWSAVLLGSLLNGSEAGAYNFSFTTNGRIDGPSAGGLMTVGVLAALRGKQVRDDATMTGTVNPDGTIGPVGGIPHKIDGAAKAGKKLVLVPIGQRYDQDDNRGELVDLVEVGRKAGVEVREVGTVFDAYEQLTGDKLPQPSGSSSSPALPQQAADRLRAGAQNLVGVYERERAQATAMPQEFLQYFEDSIKYSDDQVAQADQALKQGLFAVAYDHAYSAAGAMRQVNGAGLMLERYQRDGLAGAISQLQAASAVRSQLEAEVRQLEAKSVNTVSDALTVFDAYSEIAIGEGKILVADQIVNDLAQNGDSYSKDDAFDKIFEAARLYTEAGDSLQLAQDAVNVGTGFGKAKAPANDKLLQVAKSMQKAADANMATFKSVFVEPAASSLGMSQENFQNVLSNREPLYTLAETAQYGIGALSDAAGGEETPGLVFGHSQTTYTLASMLLAKYYSLDAQLDKDLNITSFNRTKALGEMIDFADRRARELIGQAGDDAPMRAIYYYENAQQLRQSGDANDKLNALSYYWQASLLCQMASYMANAQ